MNNNKHIPSIVKIKGLEKEVDLLLKEYSTANKNYIRNLTNGLKDKASNDAKLMEALNKEILKLLTTINDDIKAISPKGLKNKEMIQLNNKNIKSLIASLKHDERNLEKMIRSTSDSDGSLDASAIHLTSVKFHSIFYFFLFIIILFLTYKITTSTDSIMLELIIFILISVLLVYYFVWQKISNTFYNLRNYFKKKIQNLNL